MNAAEARVCLGLDADATLDEAQAAYRRRAAMLHPDKHATSAPAMQQEAERAMQQLNTALSVLRQPGADDRETLVGRPPLPHECRMCGSTPAATVTFHRVTGLVLGHRVAGLSGPLCQGCGLALWREAQGHTLIRGWWGLFAWVRSLLALATNLGARRQLRRLAPPSSRVEGLHTFLTEPHPPTRPLPLRAGVWAASAAFLLLAISAIGATAEPESVPAEAETTSVPPPVGTCFDTRGAVTGCDSLSAVAQLANTADSEAGCVPGDFYLAYEAGPGGVCLRRLAP